MQAVQKNQAKTFFDVSILYVEDEPVTSLDVSKSLKSMVKTFHAADNGEQGLRVFVEHRPDIVMTDISMPRMDGLEMAERIREMDPDVPIIVITAFEDRNLFKKAISLGVTSYLTKPIERETLREVLRKCAAGVVIQKRLEEQKRLNEMMLESLPYPAMLIHRANRQIVSHNNSATDLTGALDIRDHELLIQDENARPAEIPLPDRNPVSVRGVRILGRVWDTGLSPIPNDLVLFSAVDVTQRSEIEDALKENEEKFRSVVEDSPILICRFMPGGIITFVNRAYCEYFKKSEQELVGKSFLDLIPEEDRQAVIGHFSGLTPENPVKTYEHRVNKPDGAVSWQRWTDRAIFDEHGKPLAYQSIGEDITQRKLTQDALEQEKNFIDRVLQNSFDGIAVITREGEVKFVNPGMIRLFGYELKEIPDIGAWADRVLPDAETRKQVLDQWYRDIHSEHPFERVLKIIHKNGQDRWCRIQISHMPQGDVIMNAQDITEIKNAEERIRHLALHDNLTGLPNRQLFQDRLLLALSRSKRQDSMVALMYIDLDRFKSVNDTYGHRIGDHVLKNAAHRISASIRESDTVGRLGGDEFVVILTDLAEYAETKTIAKRIKQALNEPSPSNKYPVVTASIGISAFPHDGMDSDTLMVKADKAMYLAKKNGGNRYQFASDL